MPPVGDVQSTPVIVDTLETAIWCNNESPGAGCKKIVALIKPDLQ